MRYTRGLFQSLGASGSLLAAAACALFAVSAAVGFRGWPGLGGDATEHRALVVAVQPSPRQQRAGRTSAAIAAPRRVLAATEPQPAAARRPGAPRHSSVLATSLSSPAPAGSPARTTSPAAPAASSPAPTTSSARPVTHRAAKTVRGTGQTAAAIVAPVSPTAAQTVTTATDTVAGVVEKTGDVLAP